MDPRRPAIPLDVEVDDEHMLVRGDGSIRSAALVHYSREDVERIQAGYCCLNCGESQVGQRECQFCAKINRKKVTHEAPFPEHCWLCGFEMKAKQAERFASDFKGETWIGPRTTDEEEMEIAREIIARERYEKEKKRAFPQIWLPRDL